MRRLCAVMLLIMVSVPFRAAGSPAFDRYFTPHALRIDLYHTGNGHEEIYSLDEVRAEPFWAGNPRNLIDTLNLGSSIVRVFDLGTNAMIYSRGYCTLFDEWKTTGEASVGFARTIHESLIIPMPKGKVQVRIDTRDRQNVFTPVFNLVVDPADYHVSTDRRYANFRIVVFQCRH